MLAMYLHPFSSYSQKAIMAFYEKGVPFEPLLLGGDETVGREFAALWPVQRFPVLVDGTKLVFEATGIIEYLDALHPSPPLIPQERLAAAEVRMWDRFFDNYVNTPQQRIIFAAVGREPDHAAQWRADLETAYAVLDRRMDGREWAAGEAFSLADCAAAPALLYADWTWKISAKFEHVHAYRARLLARPSYARALDEARPYRHLFPLGAPEGRD
jgi:glutathione S-transferase